MELNRRQLIAASASLALAAAAPPKPKERTLMAYQLPPLPYAPSALEPVIDTETMELHHGKHHQTYVDNLNKAIEADSSLQNITLDQLMEKAGTLPPAVRNNGGGHWNHSFFWRLMAAPGQGGEPGGALKQQIETDLGGIDQMQEKFNAAGAGRFGSGWAWVVWAGGKLAITSTPNQDNPLMDVAEVKGVPIIGNDVWEHAYYLKHRNRRADYLKGWWQVLNWNEANARFETARNA